MYFYDDYQENIDMVKKRKDIISILVPNKKPKTNKFNHAVTFHKKYPRNKYGTIMQNPEIMCTLESRTPFLILLLITSKKLK